MINHKDDQHPIEMRNRSKMIFIYSAVVARIIPLISFVDSHGGSWQHRVPSPNRLLGYSDRHPMMASTTAVYSKLKLRPFIIAKENKKITERIARVGQGHNQEQKQRHPESSISNESDIETSTSSVGSNSTVAKLEEYLPNELSQIISIKSSISSTNANEKHENNSDHVDVNDEDELLASHQPNLDSYYESYPWSGMDQNELEENQESNNDMFFATSGHEKEVDDAFQPIRISAILSDEAKTHLTFSQRHHVLKNIVSPALKAWSSALSVIRIQDNLVVDKSQLYDGQSCGPGVGSGFPSPLVPQNHLEDGVPNTDLIVYITISAFQNTSNENVEPSNNENVQENRIESDVPNMLSSKANDYGQENSDGTGYDQDDYHYHLYRRVGSKDLISTIDDDYYVGDEVYYQPPVKHHNWDSSSPKDNYNMTTSPCTSNATIISIDDTPYMRDGNKYYSCKNETNNNITFSFSECKYTIPLANLTFQPNAAVLIPCDVYNGNQISWLHDISNETHASCYQIFHPTNTSDLISNSFVLLNSSCVTTSWNSSMINTTSTNKTLPDDIDYNYEEPEVVEEPLPNCPNSALASATYCSTDQFDRPVAGTLNYCIDESFFLEENLEQNILTTIHEFAHILGFNSQSMAHLRHKDGTPITPRDENGNVPEQYVECSGVDTGVMSIPLPSSSILQFRETRGVRVADIVTPTVRQVTRNQFDCQHLPGAELENGNSEENICIGNHWGRRVFRTDILNPILDDVPFSTRISPLTLAYFKDSGWYNINASSSSLVNEWGRGAGCGFVENKCIENDGQVNATNLQFFCNEKPGESGMLDEVQGCSSDFAEKAICSLVDYQDWNESIPAAYQYFGENPWGGADPELDFCPVYTGFSNGQCIDENNIDLKVHSSEKFGLENSRCVYSRISSRKTSLCIPMACVISDQSLRIKVDGNWQVCDYEGQIIELRGKNSNYVICPNPSRTCPSFYCPRNCLGFEGGICNYSTGKCMCSFESENCNDSIFLHTIAQIENNAGAAIYFPNAAVLSNDHRGFFERAQIAFETMSTAMLLLFAITILGVILIISFLIRSYLKKKIAARQSDKEKMIATMVVDLRIRNNDLKRMRTREHRKRLIRKKISEKNKAGGRRKNPIFRSHPEEDKTSSSHIRMTDSFSTDSTSLSRCSAAETETNTSFSLECDSSCDRSFEPSSEIGVESEMAKESDNIDLSKRAGLDGNLYADDREDLQELDQDSNSHFDSLRQRSVFRHAL